MPEIGNIRLPTEILGMIFRLIPSKEGQLNLRQVCQDFKRIVDDGFYRKGFSFFIRNDEGPQSQLYIVYNRDLELPLPPLTVINVFKLNYLTLNNLIKKYKWEELNFSHPEAVKSLKFLGLMRSGNFSMIMDQLTNIVELEISEYAFYNLRHFHLVNLKFDFLRKLMLKSEFYNYQDLIKEKGFPERVYKIQLFLTQNNFPILKELELSLFFETNATENFRIAPKDDFQMRELILFPFLKNCQNTIEKIKFKAYIMSSNKILNFSPVEEDGNLNLENYKIKCSNLKYLSFTFQKNSKTIPWLAFLRENLEKLEELNWDDYNEATFQENEAFFKLININNQNAPNLSRLTWLTSTPYFADMNFKFLKNYKSLKYLTIHSNGIETELNWNFLNCKLIPMYCPNLVLLSLSKRYIDSDSVDFLLTGNNLPNLKYVYFASKWRFGNGMTIETCKKIKEEGRIEYLNINDCVNNDSFSHQDNKEYLTSILSQDNFERLQQRLQNVNSINMIYCAGGYRTNWDLS